MIALEEKQPDGVFRKPSLIAGATKKMALTYVGGTVCATAVVIGQIGNIIDKKVRIVR